MDSMTSGMTRRAFLIRGTGLGLALAGVGTIALRALQGAGAASAKTPMTVYMDPGCGCCGKWVELMGKAGFATSVRHTSDMASIKKRYGIGNHVASCHTALVGGYLVEGHVPADLIHKMVAEKPKFAGLAVPGMVTGSPGMEGATKDPYEVLTFDAAGKTTVYARR